MMYLCVTRTNCLAPTPPIECPDGTAPKVGKFPMRGDWILAKGSRFNVDSKNVLTNTIYTYRKHDITVGGAGRKESSYQCISDHALLTFDVDFLASKITEENK